MEKSQNIVKLIVIFAAAVLNFDIFIRCHDEIDQK